MFGQNFSPHEMRFYVLAKVVEFLLDTGLQAKANNTHCESGCVRYHTEKPEMNKSHDVVKEKGCVYCCYVKKCCMISVFLGVKSVSTAVLLI